MEVRGVLPLKEQVGPQGGLFGACCGRFAVPGLEGRCSGGARWCLPSFCVLGNNAGQAQLSHTADLWLQKACVVLGLSRLAGACSGLSIQSPRPSSSTHMILGCHKMATAVASQETL